MALGARFGPYGILTRPYAILTDVKLGALPEFADAIARNVYTVVTE